MGEVTGSRLEIKTSGRYTYEMGVALFQSKNAADQALWRDWYRFTLELALAGAFSADATEQKMARTFVADALGASPATPVDVFGSPAACRAALEALPPSPDHMFLFEYNFLYVLAAGGQRGESRARRPLAGRLRAARALLRHQPRGAADLLEGRRQLPRLPRRDHRPGLGASAARPRANGSRATPRSTRCSDDISK